MIFNAHVTQELNPRTISVFLVDFFMFIHIQLLLSKLFKKFQFVKPEFKLHYLPLLYSISLYGE